MPAWTIDAATVTQAAGTLAVAGPLAVGGGGGTPGAAAYALSGGAVVAGTLAVGDGCTGTLTQTGGSLTAGYTQVGVTGFAPASDGTLAQSGGTSSLGATVVGGGAGTGTLDLSGGTTAAWWVNVGVESFDATPTLATLDLSGSASLTTWVEQVGYDGARGVVVQTGGTNATGTLAVGAYDGFAGSGTGSYTLAGGALTAAAEVVGDGPAGDPAPAVGTLTQTGGTNAVGTGGLTVGDGPAATGTLALSGGTAHDAGPLFLGLGGPATATVSGGALSVVADAYVGYSAPATLALSGTGSLTAAAALYVSGDGTAADPAGDGTLTLAGSAALTTAQTVVGYAAPATFTQTGGTHTTQTFVLDGPAGRFATYTVTAAAMVHAAVAVDAYAPAADGPAEVDEGTPYALSLFGNAALTAWQVDWGDGEVDNGTGGWAAAPHTYLVGGRTFTIVPAARDGNQTYPTPPVPVFVNDLPAAVVNPGTQSADAGQAVSVAEPFTDPGVNDAHTATVDWGDGSPLAAATIVESGGSGTVAAAHAYAGPGTYAAELTVSDQGGAATPVPFTVIVAPAAPGPSGLTATPVDDEDVQLTWTPNPADPNTSFEVDRQNADGSWTDLATVDDTTDGDAYTDSGLSGATAYAYRVRSVGATTAADSAYSTAAATTPLTTPDAPAGLAATESTAGEVDLTWADDSDIITGYGITATPAGGGTAQTFTDADGYGTFAATGLTPGAVYSFAVTADNDQGNGNDVRSDPSDPITAVVPAAALSAAAPATVAEGSPLTLSLSAAAPAAGGSPVTAWQVTWADGTTQTFANYAAGTTLTDPYAVPADDTSDAATVVATDAAGNAFTLPAVDCDVVPLAPTGVTTTVVSGCEVDLAWTDVSQSATGYEVDRADAGSAAYQDVADLPAGSDGYADASLVPGTQYTYQVEATGGGSASATASAPAAAPSAVTTPAQALALSAVLGPASSGRATLNWHYTGAPATGVEIEVEDQQTGENFHNPASATCEPFPGPVDANGNGTESVGGLTLGDTYAFRIRADLSDGTATGYASTSFQVPGLAAPSLSVGSDKSVTVTYHAGSAYGFEFESRGWSQPGPDWRTYSELPGPFAALGATGGTVADAVDIFQAAELRVRADTPAGPTLWSDPQACDDSSPTIDLPTPTVTAVAVSPTEVDVTVDTDAAESADAGFGYEVRLADATGGAAEARDQVQRTAPLNPNNSPQQTFAFTGLTPGTTYAATARSVDSSDDDHYGAGYSGYAAATPATTPGGVRPAAPDGLVAIAAKSGNKLTERHILLHWHNSSNNEDHFEIQRAWNSTFTDTLETFLTDADVTIYQDNTDYDHVQYYRVAAMRDGTLSDWSKVVIVAPTPIVVMFYGADIPHRLPYGFPNNGDIALQVTENKLIKAGYEVGEFAWNRVIDASQWLLDHLDTNHDHVYDPSTGSPPDVSRPIDILGFSWGGLNVGLLSSFIRKSPFFHDKEIDEAIAIDPVRKLHPPVTGLDMRTDWTIGSNVDSYWDYYQTDQNPPNGGIGVPFIYPTIVGIAVPSAARLKSFYDNIFQDANALQDHTVNHFSIVSDLETQNIVENIIEQNL